MGAAHPRGAELRRAAVKNGRPKIGPLTLTMATAGGSTGVERREAEQWPRRIGHGCSGGGVRWWRSSEGGGNGAVAAGSAAATAGERENE
jgi:hypothetical protein